MKSSFKSMRVLMLMLLLATIMIACGSKKKEAPTESQNPESAVGQWKGTWTSKFDSLNPGQFRPGSKTGEAIIQINKVGGSLTGFVELKGTTPPLEKIAVVGEITTGRPDIVPPCTDFVITGTYSNGSQLIIWGALKRILRMDGIQ